MKLKKQTKAQVIAAAKKRTWKGCMIASNCYPNNTPFSLHVDFQFETTDVTEKDENGLTLFERMINGYARYNCNPKTGTRVHFYEYV